MASELGIIAAFIAGLLSFASPCILPLVPGFLAFLGRAGLSGSEEASRRRIFLAALSYVLGFTFMFSLLGVLLNGLLSHFALFAQAWLSMIGGTVIILFGLHTLGLLPLEFLEQEHRIMPKRAGMGAFAASFAFGASFAVGWVPCVGAILGSILALAASSPGQSFVLLLSYSIGLGIPFLLAGAFVGQARQAIRGIGPYLKYFNIVAGALLILIGILVFTNTLSSIANLVPAQAFGGA